MITRIEIIKDAKKDIGLIKQAAEDIKAGKLVAFPTETVYGLGADGLNKEAVEKIYLAKGRPSDNPIILHVDSIAMLERLVKEIPKEAYILINRFWPGPLTLVLKKSDIVPDIITAGLDSVAIRMPSNPIALALIKESNTPIAAPSANTSGRPSPTRAEHVIEDMDGRISFIIDGGETGVGLESSVIDLTERIPMILRPGGITIEQIKEELPNVVIDPALLENDNKILIPKSPGQKYRHYAPKAEMIVYIGKREKRVKEILARANKEKVLGKNVGIMCFEENKENFKEFSQIVMGSEKDKEAIAHGLFNALRKFDEWNVGIILCEGTDEGNIGMAIMNRLEKASGGNMVYV
ncbi:MAG: L-threonylcarbamoyladenylate synthase [Gudongella sp.]|nr:L-threonylcarbamoyladenylate synthase [Gudongella sp.]